MVRAPKAYYEYIEDENVDLLVPILFSAKQTPGIKGNRQNSQIGAEGSKKRSDNARASNLTRIVNLDTLNEDLFAVSAVPELTTVVAQWPLPRPAATLLRCRRG